MNILIVHIRLILDLLQSLDSNKIMSVFESSDEDEDELTIDDSIIKPGQSIPKGFETTLHAENIREVLTTLKIEKKEEIDNPVDIDTEHTV